MSDEIQITFQAEAPLEVTLEPNVPLEITLEPTGSLEVTVDAVLIEGVPGPRGPIGLSGLETAASDPGDLTLMFDNKLL